MSQENILFEKALQRVNSILKTVGLQLIEDNNDKSLLMRLRRRLFFIFALLWFNTDLAAELAWFFNGAMTGKSLVELTYIAPAMTHCILADVKTYFFLKNEPSVNDLITTLRKLQLNIKRGRNEDLSDKELVYHSSFLTIVTRIQYWLNIVALWGFAILPFIIMTLAYLETGKIELMVPYFVLYPYFDVTDKWNWPFIYLHQMWSAKLVVLMVLGTDSLYYACSTYIQIQFRYLHHDLERIIFWVPHENRQNDKYKIFRKQFAVCMERHRKLIRCVSLMERIYSKSTLFNVVTSSMVICLTGFNATAMESWPLIMPFIAFVFLVSGQIFLFCYFGDSIMRTSSAVSDAVYNSKWYNAEVSMMRNLLFVLVRAQKPCKLTAYGFSDINLGTFTRILSTAWSYFALLSTVNHETSATN